MNSFPTRILLSLISLARPAQFQVTTISAFATFGACGRVCITSAIIDGIVSFTCSAVATQASCVCQPAASNLVYGEIVSCVNYHCAPSSTSIATQIFESYCGGDVLPTAGIQAATTTSSIPAASQSIASQTQAARTSATDESLGTSTKFSATIETGTATTTSATSTNTGSHVLSTGERDGIISGSVLGGLAVILAIFALLVQILALLTAQTKTEAMKNLLTHKYKCCCC